MKYTKSQIIEALTDPTIRSVGGGVSYPDDFIAEVLLYYDKSGNRAETARKFGINEKTVAAWAEKINVYLRKLYKKRADEAMVRQVVTTPEDVREQELKMKARHERNVAQLGSTLSKVESEMYKMSSSVLLEMINDLLEAKDEMSPSQKIGLMNTMLKLKGDSITSAKEINKRMFSYLIDQIVGYLISMFEQGKLQCADGLQEQDVFVELDRIKNMAFVDDD